MRVDASDAGAFEAYRFQPACLINSKIQAGIARAVKMLSKVLPEFQFSARRWRSLQRGTGSLVDS